MECMDFSKGGVISENSSVEYDCRRYFMVYGIEVAKFMRQTRISSVWTRETAVLNCIASVLLECMSCSDGECRSVAYGVMKIRKLVTIVQKCKMGGCEKHSLSMTWEAPIHSKTRSNKAPKRGKWVVCLSRFTCDPARKEHLLLKRWIGCMRIYKLRLKNGFSSMIEKLPPGMLTAVFFKYKKDNRFASPKWSPINCLYSYAFSRNKYDVDLCF